MNRLTSTKIFIDGGDPIETAKANQLLHDAGYAGVDGQTTNPSLVAKNPDIAGKKMPEAELLAKYKEIIQHIEKDAPGDISIEVYADKDTKADAMIAQAREFNTWSQYAVIKLPTNHEGLQAASVLKDEMRLNMTLCFSQEQAAAIYSATKGSKYPVFVSPFVGRLDDQGLDGVQHVANVLKMLTAGDGHVHVLSASFRRQASFVKCIQLGTHAVTINLGLFEPWAKAGFTLDDEYNSDGKDIPYQELDLNQDWQKFNIQHDLTDVGLQKFADDWNSLLTK